jgi:hypothetical protein
MRPRRRSAIRMASDTASLARRQPSHPASACNRGTTAMLSLLLLVLVAVLAPGLAVAQPWSGIIAPQRATDWRTAGATIPTRTTICATIAPYTGTAATINNAIAACPSGQVVQLQVHAFDWLLSSKKQCHPSRRRRGLHEAHHQWRRGRLRPRGKFGRPFL